MAKLVMKWFQVLVLASGLLLGSLSAWSEEEATESDVGLGRPSYGAVIGDTFIVRPITLVATVFGAAVWVITSPLTIVTGTIGEAGQTLVLDPFANTFLRCLGCTEVGWRKLPPEDVR